MFLHRDEPQRLCVLLSRKMIWMEKQLESLTELVKELTRERAMTEQHTSTKTGLNAKGTVVRLIAFHRTSHSIGRDEQAGVFTHL